MARVLLVEPFLAGSHEAWANGWAAHSRHTITCVGHEGRYWRWRMRGAAVSLAREVNDRAEEIGPIDVVVASNMLDLAGFAGLARRVVGEARLVQYMHESQLSYPRQPGEALDSGLAWMQWRGMVVSDEVWWNSAFHQRACLGALDDLLAEAPDHGHAHERAEIDAASWVLPPGVEYDDLPARPREANPRPLIVSNQRWHHDKDVAAVVRAVQRLIDRGFDVDLAVVGDSSGGEAARIDPLLDGLGERVIARGLLERGAYLDLLARADIVVSAARGENFGIGVVEAVAAGAWPVLPDGLAYPEVIPEAFHGDCLYGEGQLGRRLAATVEAVASGRAAPIGLAEAMAVHAWPAAAARLDDRIDGLGAV